MIGAGIAAALLAAFVPGIAAAMDVWQAQNIALPENAPRLIAPWRATTDAPLQWEPVVAGADRTFSDTITDGQNFVHRFVALYLPHGRSSNLIRSENRIADQELWRRTGRSRIVETLGGRSIPIEVTRLIAGTQKITVWSFYVIEGDAVIGLSEIKWRQLRAFASGSTCSHAFVALAFEENDIASPSEVLSRALAAIQPPSQYLCDRSYE